MSAVKMSAVKMSAAKMGVAKMKADKMGVDKMRADKMRADKIGTAALIKCSSPHLKLCFKLRRRILIYNSTYFKSIP